MRRPRGRINTRILSYAPVLTPSVLSSFSVSTGSYLFCPCRPLSEDPSTKHISSLLQTTVLNNQLAQFLIVLQLRLSIQQERACMQQYPIPGVLRGLISPVLIRWIHVTNPLSSVVRNACIVSSVGPTVQHSSWRLGGDLEWLWYGQILSLDT